VRLARLEERTSDRDNAISVGSFRAQLKAIHRWGQQEPADLASKRFGFDQTLEALAYVEQGRANGKVVITLD
jgi:hypothetical protein